MAGVEAKPLKKVNKPYKIRREGSFVSGFKYKGGVVSKYIIAVVFLLGLMQGKTEALGLENEINRISDELLIIRELAVVSKKYTKCTITKDDKKRLACFDSLTIYIKEREKKYENLDKALGLNNKPFTYSLDGSIRQSPDGKFRCVGFPKVRSLPECEKKFKEAKERTERLFHSR